MQKTDEVEVPPDIGPAIGLVRNVGYTLESAIADIIDNSVTAGATEITVGLEWNEGDPVMFVLDNGRGMDEAGLHEAFRIGSQVISAKRTATDHGRFSVGLKTASFSQGRHLCVLTKEAGKAAHGAHMDLDRIGEVQRWVISPFPSEAAKPWLHLADRLDQGTLVVVRKIDRLGNSQSSQETFNSVVSEVFRRLELIFHCITTGRDPTDVLCRQVHPRVAISLNGMALHGLDVLLYENLGSDWKPTVRLPAPHDQVRVRWGTLPNPQDLDEKTLKTLATHGDLHLMDGFYVYRNRRLITHGSWLGIGIGKEQHTRLARVVISIPDNTLDKEWGIDVGKSKSHLPKGLRPWFTEFAQRAQGASKGMLGPHLEFKRIRFPKDSQEEPIYILEQGGSTITVRINENHPRVKELLSTPQATTVREILNIFEFRLEKETRTWLSRL